MASNQLPSIWVTMDYVPPRGQCNFKQSLVSGRCPCLRFMLHPLKSSSSYDCDGCGHHASFHNMENKQEDDIRKRWEQDAKDKAQWQQEAAAGSRPRKRLREVEYHAGDVATSRIRAIEDGLLTREDADTASEAGNSRTRASSRGRGKKGGAGRGSRSKGRVTEISEGDELTIELD